MLKLRHRRVIFMKLITLECPYCNANIEVNAELTQGTCNYCGRSFLIENELKKRREMSEQDGYDFEKGRIRAKKEEEQNEKDRIAKETEKNNRALATIRSNNIAGFWVAFTISMIVSIVLFSFQLLTPYFILYLCGGVTVICFIVKILRLFKSGMYYNFYGYAWIWSAVAEGYIAGAIVRFIYFLLTSSS